MSQNVFIVGWTGRVSAHHGRQTISKCFIMTSTPNSNSSFSPHPVLLLSSCCGLSALPPEICFSDPPFILSFLIIFIMKYCIFLPNAFSASLGMIMGFSPLLIYYINFNILTQPCIPEIIPTCPQNVIIFICC